MTDSPSSEDWNSLARSRMRVTSAARAWTLAMLIRTGKTSYKIVVEIDHF